MNNSDDLNAVGTAESNENVEVIEDQGVDDLKAQMPSELDSLKQRAKVMGIKHHPKIGLDKLKTKITDFQAAAKKDDAKRARELANQNEQEAQELLQQKVTPGINKSAIETKGQKRNRLHKESARLVRIRISNMNPNKKEWEGEMFTVSNSVVGTFKKYVPFNNEDGWHVPTIIYKMLKDKQCQIFHTVKNNRGAKVRKGKLIKEYAIELLPALTLIELKELAQRQALAHSID